MISVSAHGAAMIDQASVFSFVAHQAVEHKRKYTGEPYYKHPIAVAQMVRGVKSSTWQDIAIAYLHDTVEDTGVKLDDIFLIFGREVREGVEALTNVDKSFGNRKARCEIDIQRLSKARDGIKTVKIADLIDNTTSIVQYDPGFAPVYLKEKRELLKRALIGGDPELWKRAFDQCNAELQKLGIIS